MRLGRDANELPLRVDGPRVSLGVDGLVELREDRSIPLRTQIQSADGSRPSSATRSSALTRGADGLAVGRFRAEQRETVPCAHVQSLTGYRLTRPYSIGRPKFFCAKQRR